MVVPAWIMYFFVGMLTLHHQGSDDVDHVVNFKSSSNILSSEDYTTSVNMTIHTGLVYQELKTPTTLSVYTDLVCEIEMVTTNASDVQNALSMPIDESVTTNTSDEQNALSLPINESVDTFILDELERLPFRTSGYSAIWDQENTIPIGVSLRTGLFDDITKGLQFFIFADLLSTLYCVVLFFMGLLLCCKKKQVSSLQQEINNTVRKCIDACTSMDEISLMLDDQQSQYTKATFKLACFNKKINEVSSELDDEHNDIEQMYECLQEWKQDWMEQSHKIRQINPDHLKQLTEQSSSKVDTFIEEQNEEIRSFCLYAGEQFARINEKLYDNHLCVMSMLADIDSIHDALNEQSAGEW